MGPLNLHLYAAFTALFWGTNFLLAAPVLADMSPMAAASGRFVLAALVMAAMSVARGESLINAARRGGGRLVLLGVVGIVGFNVLFFAAMRSTSAVNGALIMATNPLVTAVLAALFLREQLPGRQIAALPVALAGVSMVILGGGAANGGVSLGLGDVEMMAANVIWAVYNVLARRMMPAVPPLAGTSVMMAAGAVVLTGIALAEGTVFVVPGPAAALSLVGMAVFGSALAYLFWNKAIAGLGAGRAALYLNLVPVFASAGAALIGNPPNVSQLAGGAVVVGAVMFSMIPSRRPRPCLA